MAIDRNELLRRQLKALDGMGCDGLRSKFQELYGFDTDSRNLDCIRRRVAYRLQEFQLGGLSAEDEAFLDGLADSDDLSRLVNAPAAKVRNSSDSRSFFQ